MTAPSARLISCSEPTASGRTRCSRRRSRSSQSSAAASSARNSPPARKPIRPSDRADRRDKGEGSAVRAEGRRAQFHPAGGRPRFVEGHHRGISRPVRNRPRYLRRQGPEHVRGGAVCRPSGGRPSRRLLPGSGRTPVPSHGLELRDDALQHADALKAAIEKAGKVEKEAVIDALEGLVIKSPTGPVTIGKNHHATMNMFVAKTRGRDLVTVRTLGALAPDPRCQ